MGPAWCTAASPATGAGARPLGFWLLFYFRPLGRERERGTGGTGCSSREWAPFALTGSGCGRGRCRSVPERAAREGRVRCGRCWEEVARPCGAAGRLLCTCPSEREPICLLSGSCAVHLPPRHLTDEAPGRGSAAAPLTFPCLGLQIMGLLPHRALGVRSARTLR